MSSIVRSEPCRDATAERAGAMAHLSRFSLSRTRLLFGFRVDDSSLEDELAALSLAFVSRFARDLMVQLAGHDMLKAKGITLVAASAPTFFVEDTPTAVLVRQVLGAIAQFEKTALVAKLAAARRRSRSLLKAASSIAQRAAIASSGFQQRVRLGKIPRTDAFV
jgi:hypothetical protein